MVSLQCALWLGFETCLGANSLLGRHTLVLALGAQRPGDLVGTAYSKQPLYG